MKGRIGALRKIGGSLKMRKTINGLILIMVFLFSSLAIPNLVQAHFTLGDLTGTFRYHSNDFDPHVPGVIGYVWPGGGQNSYSGSPNFASVKSGPGYQSPYPGGRPGAVAGFSGNAPSSSWYQLEGDAYAPFGAVLTGSVGDLIFAVNATAWTTAACQASNGGAGCTRFTGRWRGIDLLIPPGFSVPSSPQIVSTITNDYTGISVYRIAPYDRYAPGWTLVEILADWGSDATAPTTSPSIPVYYDHQAIDFTPAGEWYYIRINGVLAPSTAGRYFFKILLDGGTGWICGEEGTGFCSGSSFTSPVPPQFIPTPGSQFIPTENWPVMLVKGEIDPGILTGTIRYAGYNQTLYSLPLAEAGKIYAKMTTRLDPYTGQSRPDLPLVDAVGYFNATAHGHYEVEGVAPGIYDLYASAMGFPQTLIASRVTILKGQSLHFDGYLQPGPVIHGNVFTKHQFGDEPWPLAGGYCQYGLATANPCSTNPTNNPDLQANQYIKVELYDAPTLSHIPSAKANMVSWSPLPCVAGGQEIHFPYDNAGLCGDPRFGDGIAAPWHEYVPSTGYCAFSPGGSCSGAGGVPGGWNFYQVSTGQASLLGVGASSRLTQDPQGVGPPQHWYVLGGTTNPFHFEFGVKGEYGAPRDLDGRVPQVYATWVNGLTPGRYYARAWTFRYVQAALDGSTFQEYYFDITPNEWAGDVTLPIDLRLASWVNKTIHFHNVINGIMEDPIDTGAGMMSGVLVDANSNVWSYNQTLLGYKGSYTNGRRSGWGSNAFLTQSTVHTGNDLDKGKLNANAVERGRANFQFWGWNDTWSGENYGIPSGTYTPHVYVLGYLEKGPVEQVSVTLSGNPTSISNHVFRGAGFNITVYSIDWERPRVSRNWVWGNPVGYTASGLATSLGSGPNVQIQKLLGNDPRCPNTPGNCMVGEEIDIGIYQNGTLVDFIGDEPSNLQDTVLSSCLFQSQINSSIQLCGGGWDAQLLLPNGTYITYQGNSNDAYFGQELSNIGLVGGYIGGTVSFLTTSLLFAPARYSPSNLPDGGTYMQATRTYTGAYPTAIPQGQYDLRGYTYGYVQDKSFSLYAMPSQVADIKVNLIIGVNITIDILFKKEHIITPTNANMSARVRIFDDSANLVAEWMSSEGTYVTGNGFARAADGTDQYPFGPLHPAVPVPKLVNGYNFLPGGVTLLHILTAGLPQVPTSGTDSGVYSVGLPQEDYFNDPLFATTTCGFQINCFTNPGAKLGVGVPGYFPNTGILGAPDYQGGWTAEVDFINWYANNTSSTQNCVVFQTGTECYGSGNYYPPVQGLLMGESYHIIPGTTAKSGISLTEDTALKPELIAHTLVANHLGPYSQQGVWQISGAHNSGEASAIQEVDLNGLVAGNALAFTWSNEFRPLSWGTVTVTGAGLPSTGLNFYTYDGVYEAYLPSTIGGSGSVIYTFSLKAPGYAPQTWKEGVSSGQTGTGQNIYLEQTNIPIPEFSTLAIAAFSALGASIIVLRRRRH